MSLLFQGNSRQTNSCSIVNPLVMSSTSAELIPRLWQGSSLFWLKTNNLRFNHSIRLPYMSYKFKVLVHLLIVVDKWIAFLECTHKALKDFSLCVWLAPTVTHFLSTSLLCCLCCQSSAKSSSFPKCASVCDK